MTDAERLIADSATRLFASHCDKETCARAEEGVFPASLWRLCDEAGLTDAWQDEPPNRFNIGNVATIVRIAARHAVPLPLAETNLARMMLTAAGMAVPTGPLTIGPVVPDQHLSLGTGPIGRLDRLPWGRDAALVALARDGEAECTLLLLQPSAPETGWNYAREPRDSVVIDAAPIATGHGWSPLTLALYGAVLRAAQMVGAMETILDLTVRYATDRVQFGRPIGKFQAVQQQIAVLASHVAAASAAVRGAVDASTDGPAAFEIAAAKLRAGEAAAAVSEIAHQVHGAIGFTHEHELHRYTRRLWSWRDEFGSESIWAMRIGRLVSGLGGEGLWPFLTDPQANQI
jgi:alkylation response protein AidB-like acyl-CoA dehydrogenase